MSVETVGSPPPEVDQLRTVLQGQLPQIIASFNQVLREQYGISGVSVGGFTVVPASSVAGEITCDQDNCSIS
ncbi:MAG: hypothetical protein KGQ93_08175 [Cyanobacteria bacterium REEB459]|nr:hypothetical protein [Cyanobacteria bacterium REEB459]